MTEDAPEDPPSEAAMAAEQQATDHDDLRHLAQLVVLDDEGNPMPYEEAAAWLAENVQDRKDEFTSYLTDDA